MNNELFKLYLEEVNRIEADETTKRFKRANKRFIRSIDMILIGIIGACIGLMTVWAIAQEVLMKLR